MVSSKISIFSLIIFHLTSWHATASTTFTKEIIVNHGLAPAKLNDENIYTYFNENSTIITTVGEHYQECRVPGIIPTDERVTLGNGKMMGFTLKCTHFSILDFKNCSTHSVIDIDDGTKYYYEDKKLVVALIPHYDTVDVYSKTGSGCTPCRYNDKGERQEVNSTLKSELTNGEYFIEPMKNISGGGDGYLHGSSNDYSIVLRILDSNYKVSKEIELLGKHEAHSSTYKHITVCTSINTCPEQFTSICPSIKCHLLDWNLNEVSTATMHEPIDRYLNYNYVYINNLENGGAMATMEYIYYDLFKGTNRQYVSIQQIHVNGTVEPEIHFGRFTSDFISTHDYISRSGEYCVMVRLFEKGWVHEDHDKKGIGKTLIKCVDPRPPTKN